MPQQPPMSNSPKPSMHRWKKILIGVLVVAVVVGVGGPLIYKLLNPAKTTATDELNQRQAAATTPASAAGTTATAPAPTAGSADPGAGTTVAPTVAGSVAGSVAATAASGSPASTAASPAVSTAAASAGLDGTWKVESTTDVNTLYVGYRVNEVLAGQKVTATGRSASVTGSLTISGTKVSTADFTVQTATLKSDKDQRDQQYNGRIMETSKFPTATFKLTSPIDFAKVPVGTEKVTASATGDLTLHGVTKSVTFDVSGFVSGNQLTIAGEIPVKFAGYSIANPSFGPISTDDHGALEFLLVFDKS